VPRRLSIPSVEMGRIELYLIYNEDGVWEEEWRPLQGVMDIPEVTKEVMDHALHGWTRLLVDQLGPPPEGMLRKLPSQRCEHEKSCPFHVKRRCLVLSSKMPWCFEPAGVSPGALAGEVIKLWRSEVYVLAVLEPPSDERRRP
jgi:hypothetical protein